MPPLTYDITRCLSECPTHESGRPVNGGGLCVCVRSQDVWSDGHWLPVETGGGTEFNGPIPGQGGEMIDEVYTTHSSYACAPSQFEAGGTPPIAQAVGD